MLEDASDPGIARDDKLARGSEVGQVDLPWLDIEKTITFGVNAYAGDDTAFRLDFRDSATVPVVLFSRITGRAPYSRGVTEEYVFLATVLRTFLAGIRPHSPALYRSNRDRTGR